MSHGQQQLRAIAQSGSDQRAVRSNVAARAMGGDRHELARVPLLHIAAACVLVTEQLVQLSACRTRVLTSSRWLSDINSPGVSQPSLHALRGSIAARADRSGIGWLGPPRQLSVVTVDPGFAPKAGRQRSQRPRGGTAPERPSQVVGIPGCRRHSPRRRSASLCTSMTWPAAAKTRSRWRPRTTYSRTARRAASCIEMPSASARSRSAACSSSVRRNVMAMPAQGIGLIPLNPYIRPASR
jgi:hypothetical protein